MSEPGHRPLGERIPKKLHAVSCSLPTMRDVIGYETKDPGTIARICSGYPRFVVHGLNQDVVELFKRHHGLEANPVWLTASRQIADELVAWLDGAGARVIEEGGLWGVTHPADDALSLRARQFLQHTGGFLSSRQAEDRLVAAGRMDKVAEETVAGDAVSLLRSQLARGFGASDPDAIVLAGSGMNAFYRAFRSASAAQSRRGRSIWIQLGWLYLDTMAVIEKLGNGPEDRKVILQIDDLDTLRRVVTECGPRLAGLITEAPSNPLIQTPDLAAVAEMVHEAGGLMIVDPSVASAFNVDVFPYADLIATSLTKYTAWEGDVIAGAVVVGDFCPDRQALIAELAAETAPLYHRDAARLAWQGERAPGITRVINDQTREVATFLESHPAVRKVFWAEASDQVDQFRKVRRPGGGPGALITFDLVGSLETFYDRVALPKGPSFGITTTLICPFLYLAHYDLVSTDQGRSYLQANRLNPELVRLSVGTEPLDTLLAALDAAL